MPKKRGDQGFDHEVFGQFDYRSPALWGEDQHRRAIMACLVQGVYRMERDRANGCWKKECDEISRTTPVWWETFHYGIQELIYETVDEGGSFFGAVYHSKLPHNHKGAPKIVVAFRGTMVKMKDYRANWEIFLNQFCSHSRCDTAVNVVQRYGPQSVCLAGHSNGAALALLVGRKIAEGEGGGERCLLEAHLFNPPHPAATISSIPLPMPPGLTSAVQYLHDVAATGVSRVLQDKSTRQLNHNRFLSLRDWMPNIYINKHDWICVSYLSHFQATQHVQRRFTRWLCDTGLRSPAPISIRAMLIGRDGNAGADHLIPSARLHIHTDKILKAHKLEQWLDLKLQITPSPSVYVDPQDSNHHPNHDGEEEVLET